MTIDEFREYCPSLVHFAPQIDLARGLLTAAQVLDLNQDEKGQVWARFRYETAFRPYPVDHWKSRSRFLRGAGEAGSCLVVRDAGDHSRSHILGNNYPLGTGRCIGTTLKLTDNRDGDQPLSREDWFRTLNNMFWVFPESAVNAGFVNRLRGVTPGGRLHRVRLLTRSMPEAELIQRVRLSAINGGGSNGGFARGTATYKPIGDWAGWPPKEIGLYEGLPVARCATLLAEGGLTVQEA